MANLNNDSKIQFNNNMHGQKKGDIIGYGRSTNSLKLLIRRRIKDNDGSVTVINPVIAKPKSKTEAKPKKAEGSQTKPKGAN